MRKFFSFVLLLVLAVAGWLAWALYLPVAPSEPKFVLLRPGWTTRHIARELKDNGIIRSDKAFLFMHILRGERSLKAGEYKFDSPANALNVRDRLTRGDIYVRQVTVPEGYNMFDIAQAVEQAGLGTAAEFLNAARQDLFLLKDVDPTAKSLEGYLFPDTYSFTRTMSSHDMATAMVHRFKQEAKALNLDSDVHRVVTMASIVEKETAVPDERPQVASVYYNRLDKNMTLAADPSVIYAALLNNRYRGTIYQSDLQYDSPYNTYKYAGLPPGPIANPGRAALAAAMHPAQTQYLYFVADAQGHHRFAATLDEHNRNVLAYRRAIAAK
ncbi:aminodeoxychorismate lyase [Candidatus Koribacter versatilis Ellin345]|uniref:Endolytic murein transglycosylase n=1 Tax=Koribacter versatilis (strain Ellin345) TaxID=204669 RepID=Q1IU88_KORVE|nr:endolytic transglycosylase MltG [Candidatus Koribacter versatilis]ABF39562.1 aminodeoxychorismate lyase [Candidatus Koribacter versatilis Ellin345]